MPFQLSADLECTDYVLPLVLGFPSIAIIYFLSLTLGFDKPPLLVTEFVSSDDSSSASVLICPGLSNFSLLSVDSPVSFSYW